MRYKTNNKFWKDAILFRCECGSHEFLEIVKIDFNDAHPQYSVSIMSERQTLLEKLKYLFKPKQYVKEILLSQEDIESLEIVIKKFIKKDKGVKNG